MVASMGGATVGQVVSYVQINPPNAPQPGGFNTQTGQVASFTDTGLSSHQCVQTGAGGLLTTTGAQCGTGGGGGNASTLGVNNFGVPITTPTAQINFIGPISVTAVGSTATVTISQISLSTGVTGSLPTSRIAPGQLPSTVIASSLTVNSVYPAAVSTATYGNITLPAPNIASGYLGSMVIISSAAPASIGVPQLNFTGTPSSSTIARGDGAWASPSSLGLGTITSVVTGPGLTGGGSSGTVTVGISAVDLISQVSGILPIANGGNGTATPGVLQGSNILITGAWPNQVINATTSGAGGNGAQVNTAQQYDVPFYSTAGTSNTLSGSANFTYNQTTMTVLGPVVASTFTATGEYCFKDGTCQTTAGGNGGGGVGGAFASWYLVDSASGKWQVVVDLGGHLATTSVSAIPPGALAPHTLVTQDKNFNLWTIGIDTGGHLTTASAGSTAQSITDLLMNDSTSITWLITIDTGGHLVTS